MTKKDILDYFKDINHAYNDCSRYDSLERMLDELQTAQQERKKGKWIPEFNGMFKGGAYWFKCSECERIVPEVRNGGWNYCPNCGAEMEGQDDRK